MPESVFDHPDCYTRQEELRALPRMLMDGTPRLHAECVRWLPPHSAKEREREEGGVSDYDVRVQRSVVEPFYQRSVKRAVATVLGKQIKLQDDVPPEIAGTEGDNGGQGQDGWWENIDQRGNNGDVFLRAVVEDAEGDAGFSVVLVDFPEVPEGFKLSDVKAARMRPFWRHYKARDVVRAVPEVINGRERAAALYLAEMGEDETPLMRVLKPAPWDKSTQALVGFATWELWKQEQAKEGSEKVDVLVGSGSMEPHQEIPAHPLYFDRCGFYEGRPPQLHLAYLNLKHTREQSDISEDLRISSGAQMHRAGATADEVKNQRAIGPRVLLASADSGAKAEWLERSGAAANVYMEYEDNLEAKMERIGNEPHIRRTGNETATASAIDAAKAKTEIQVKVIAVKDFVESLLSTTAVYLGLPNGGSVEIRTPPAQTDFTNDQMRLLMDAANGGFIQKFRIPEALKNIGILPDEVDPEAEANDAAATAPPPVSGTGDFAAAADKVRQAISSADGTQAPPAQPGTPQAPAPGSTHATPPAVGSAQDVQVSQAAVLNGAQITAATAIVTAVAAGDIPRDAGMGQLQVLFNLTETQAAQIMGSAGTDTPTTPNPKPAAEGDGNAPPPPANTPPPPPAQPAGA